MMVTASILIKESCHDKASGLLITAIAEIADRQREILPAESGNRDKSAIFTAGFFLKAAPSPAQIRALFRRFSIESML